MSKPVANFIKRTVERKGTINKFHLMRNYFFWAEQEFNTELQNLVTSGNLEITWQEATPFVECVRVPQYVDGNYDADEFGGHA